MDNISKAGWTYEPGANVETSDSAQAGAKRSDGLPNTTGITGISPNPFNASTRIQYALTESSPVVLRIFDISGRHIRTLVDTVMPAGWHTVDWHGRNDHGQPVNSGVYFLRMSAGSVTYQQKLVIVE